MSNHYFDPRLKIFSLNSNKPLAKKIADAVGVELGKSEVKQFTDGENSNQYRAKYSWWSRLLNPINK